LLKRIQYGIETVRTQDVTANYEVEMLVGREMFTASGHHFECKWKRGKQELFIEANMSKVYCEKIEKLDIENLE
ncbi:5620_t:CDS:2, partial [Funneliformis geosporum]